jgi:hypothetical protein
MKLARHIHCYKYIEAAYARVEVFTPNIAQVQIFLLVNTRRGTCSS